MYENVRFYKNYMFVTITTHTYERNKFEFKVIIDSVVQDGKKMVDGNFSKTKNHPINFINESRIDFIVPEYVIEALTSDK